MKKQFLLGIITSITSQIYAMEIESHKEPVHPLILLQLTDSLWINSIQGKTITKQSNNTKENSSKEIQINCSPASLTNSTTASSDILCAQKSQKIIPLLEEKNDMEIVPLDNAKNIDLVENTNNTIENDSLTCKKTCFRCICPLITLLGGTAAVACTIIYFISTNFNH